jgi:tetrathionate reductase subunit B
MSANHGLDRRRFFAISAAALGGIALAPGVRLIEFAVARTPEQAASRQVRWGLLIDTNQCAVGCADCVNGCATENAIKTTAKRTDVQWIRTIDLKDKRSGRAQSVPVMCQHCEHPPCVDVCPTGASFKRADGIVLVDQHVCIGCRYCMMACPYKARSLAFSELAEQNPEVPRGKGCAEGCTLCVHRIDKDRLPACVEACAKAGHNAMVFGNLNDPKSEIAQRVAKFATTQIRADLRLNPGVRYQGL